MLDHVRAGRVERGSNIAFLHTETSETSSKSHKLSATWPAPEIANRHHMAAVEYST